MRETALDTNKAFASSKEPGAVRFEEGLRLSRRQRKSLLEGLEDCCCD